MTDAEGVAPKADTASTATIGPRRRLADRVRAGVAGLWPCARPHRRALVVAVLASLCVVAIRLALPWPLRAVVELAVVRSGGLGAAVHPAVAFALLGVGLGLAEHRQRLSVARFAVRTVNAARLSSLEAHLRLSSTASPLRGPGDVLTRLVGDAARVRIGLRSVLVHLMTHGAFLLGVCVVLVAVDPVLGGVYLAGLLAAAGVALRGAARASGVARQRRGRETRLAERVLRVTANPAAKVRVKDPGRARSGVQITVCKGRTAWAAQGVLAVSACAALVLGLARRKAGALSTGDLVLVAHYLRMSYHRMVRVGRQLTRLGPLLASAERLARVPERSHHPVKHRPGDSG